MRKAALFGLAASVLGLWAGPVPAASPTGLGVDHFTSGGQRSELGTGLSNMSDTLLSQILADPAYKDCRIDQVEVRRTAERQRELELGRSPLADPAARVRDRTIQAGHRITGSVVESGNGGSFSISLVNAQTGEVMATATGGGAGIPEIEKALRDGLVELLDRLCPRMHHLKASVGLLQIDTQVCGFDRPFRVAPRGAFAGVVHQFTPSSRDSGSYTHDGRAYATRMVGSGQYTVAWSGDVGRFTSRETYEVSNAAGRNVLNEGMTGTVTRLKQRCRR